MTALTVDCIMFHTARIMMTAMEKRLLQYGAATVIVQNMMRKQE